MAEKTKIKNVARGGRALAWERRRKKRDTREEILVAATHSFSQKGYDATSLNDIARKVGIKVPSIYNHFKSKRAILFASLMETGREHLNQLKNNDLAAGDDPYRRLQVYIQGRIEHEIRSQKQMPMVDIGTLHKILESKSLTPAQKKQVRGLMRELGQVLQDILKAGRSKRIMNFKDATVTFHAILSMLDSIVYWYNPAGDIAPDEIADRFNVIARKMLS